MTLCACGCGQITPVSRWNNKRADVKAGKHFAYCHGHGRRRTTTEDRFWSKVAPAEADECWLWNGYRKPDGYGSFVLDSRPQQAHRVAWTLLRGDIPDGLHIDHLCLTPACVNPWHMELVTNAENARRVHTRGPAVLPQDLRHQSAEATDSTKHKEQNHV